MTASGFRLSWTWLVVAVAATVAAGDPPPRTVRSPSGAWSAVPPTGWQADDAASAQGDAVRFAGPEGPLTVLRIETLPQPMPMSALVEQIQKTFAERGVALEAESPCTTGERAAWTYEYLEQQGGLSMRVVQALVDGGPRKVLVSLTGPEPLSASARAVVPAVLKSLALATPDATLPELKTRDFAALGIAIDLPAGGEVRETPLTLDVAWAAEGITFRAGRRRTALPPAEMSRWDAEGFDVQEGRGFAIDGIVRETVEVAGKPAELVRFYLARDGVRYVTTTVIYRSSGKGEVTTLGFGFLGERRFEDLSPWEKCLTAAQVAPFFGPPPEKAPVPAEKDGLSDAIRFKLPARWTRLAQAESAPREVAPRPEAVARWAPERSPDLGVRAETGPWTGGAAAFEAWLTGKRWRKRDVARVEPAADAKAGNRAAKVWRVSHGPPQERWQTEIVASFQGERYFAIEQTYPVAMKALFIGLAEKIAATTEWGK